MGWRRRERKPMPGAGKQLRGILKCDELAASWQRNRFVETALPPPARHQANRPAPASVNFT
jgi:hypothetical protein